MNKKMLLVVTLLVLVSFMLTACNNPRAEKPGNFWPWTWGDKILEQSLQEGCIGGATSTVIDGSTYTCPGIVQAPPPSPEPVVTATPEDILVITWNPCEQGANPELQIEPLVENGETVPDAFMGLDLNRSEVNSGMKYSLYLSSTAYAQFFNAWDGMTRDAKGQGTFESTAYTVWCMSSNYRAEISGRFQIMDAKNIPDNLSADPQPLPFIIVGQ